MKVFLIYDVHRKNKNWKFLCCDFVQMFNSTIVHIGRSVISWVHTSNQPSMYAITVWNKKVHNSVDKISQTMNKYAYLIWASIESNDLYEFSLLNFSFFCSMILTYLKYSNSVCQWTRSCGRNWHFRIFLSGKVSIYALDILI